MQWLSSIGVTAFIVASEQGLIRRAATEVCDALRKLSAGQAPSP